MAWTSFGILVTVILLGATNYGFCENYRDERCKYTPNEDPKTCLYGVEFDRYCNKFYCLKGPNQTCDDINHQRFHGQCTFSAICCNGICVGCVGENEICNPDCGSAGSDSRVRDKKMQWKQLPRPLNTNNNYALRLMQEKLYRKPLDVKDVFRKGATYSRAFDEYPAYDEQ